MAKYNIGIIGCGFIAEQQVAALKEIPEIDIIGIVTRHKETSLTFKEKMNLENCKCFQNYHDLLAMKNLDFISISLPNNLHKEVLFAAADIGKHVICEKPVANNLEEVDEMVNIMDKKNLKFAVYHEAAFYPENLLIKELLKEDEFLNTKLAWDGAYAIGKWNWGENHWRTDPLVSGGGVIMDEGVHLCHLLKIYFGNKKPLFVSAFMDRLGEKWIPCEDTATMIFQFSTGMATASTSFQPLIGRNNNLKTYSQGIITEKAGIEIVFIEDAEGIFSPVKEVLVTTPKKIKNYQMPKYSWPLEKNIHAFKKLYEDFIDSIENNRSPYVDGKSARDAMEMVMASYESAAIGKAIEIPLEPSSPIYKEGVLGLKKYENIIPKNSILRRKNMYGITL